MGLLCLGFWALLAGLMGSLGVRPWEDEEEEEGA